MTFYIVSPEEEYGPCIPWGEEEKAITYNTYDAAKKAAEDHAKDHPGEDFYIVKVIASTRCEVANPETKAL